MSSIPQPGNGSSYSTRDVLTMFVIPKVEQLERELDDLKGQSLTRDGVAQQIGQALRDSEARGWTRTERLIALALALVTISSFGLNVFQAISS